MTEWRKYVQNFRDLRFTDVLERATELHAELFLVRQEVKLNHATEKTWLEQGVFSTTDLLTLDVKTEPYNESDNLAVRQSSIVTGGSPSILQFSWIDGQLIISQWRSQSSISEIDADSRQSLVCRQSKRWMTQISRLTVTHLNYRSYYK